MKDEQSQLPAGGLVRIKETGLESTRAYISKTNRYILEHDAFSNETFVRNFVTDLKCNGCEDKLVNVPFLDVLGLFKAGFCIEFKAGEMSMCLPSLCLAKKNTLILGECIHQMILTEQEKYMSLLLATREGNVALVQKLIGIGTETSNDALQIATINQNLEIMNLLLQNKKQSNRSSHIQNENSPLIMAAKRGFSFSVKCLLQGGVDINYRNKRNVSALDKAVVENHLEVCKVLLQGGAKLNEKGGKFKRTPLHTAVDMGRTDLVNLLLKFGADVGINDHKGEYPIYSAAFQGHVEILRTLLEKDIPQGNLKMGSRRKGISFKSMSLYHLAVRRDDQELFKVLNEFKIDPDTQDEYGRTPLYLAAFYGKIVFMRSLMDFADPDKAEKNGYTPLHAAVFKQHLDIVRLLCNCSRVNVNKFDKRGYTPLHLACKSANAELIRELLMSSNIDIRMKTKKGDTLFHILKVSCNKTENLKMKVPECIDALLQKDPTVSDILNKM